MFRILTIVCTASVLSAPSLPVAEAAVSVTVSSNYSYIVTDGGAGGYEAFPDICRLQNGNIMCVFYAGYAHVSTPNATYPNGGRIMYATSSDNGASWGTAAVLYDGPLDDRDSSIYQLPGGRLICNFFSSGTSAFGSGGTGTWITTSDNLGATWSSPTQPFSAANYYTSSPIRRLSNGRLVMGLYYSTTSAAYGAVTLSDDNGGAWTSPIKIPTSVRLDAETNIIELNDGKHTLWAAERNNTTSSPMYYSTSADWGNTWTNSKPLGFHAECPYLWRSAQGVILLGYRGISGGSKYTALRYSLDECATWSNPITIDANLGAYPSMANLADGSVLVAYYKELDGSADICMRTITITGVPEPGTLALLTAGLIGLLAYVWRKKR
jgi:sialidase-1